MYEKAGMKVMESEWKSVKPKDKELRSYLTWRWAKDGYDWDPETGVAIERSLETGDCDPLGSVLKGKAEGEPVATISDIATDGLMKSLADLGL